jgi:hypothetical protein
MMGVVCLKGVAVPSSAGIRQSRVLFTPFVLNKLATATFHILYYRQNRPLVNRKSDNILPTLKYLFFAVPVKVGRILYRKRHFVKN